MSEQSIAIVPTRLTSILENEIIIHKNYVAKGGSAMSEMYDVAVKVISRNGICRAEHKVGDEWILGQTTPQGLCVSALNSMLPMARVLRYGGSFPYGGGPDVVTIACPNPENLTVYELRRLYK